MIYKFRIILDNETDIFRDIALVNSDTLEDFHNAIVNAFGFDGTEMASFYTCNDTWIEDKEIPLLNPEEGAEKQKEMQDYMLSDLLDQDRRKLLYVYDFLNMWTFLIELAAIEPKEEGARYPMLLFAHGILPEASDALHNDFIPTEDDLFGEFEDDFDEDDFKDFESSDNFEDFGFEEHWN